MDKVLAALPEEKRGKFMALKKMSEQFMSQEAKITEWNGFIFPPGFNAENAKFAYEEWDMPENSVFLHSFPKTGTNWLSEVLRQTLYGHDEKILGLSKNIPMPLFVLEMGPVKKYDLLEHLPLPRLFFISHLHEEAFNYKKMKSKKGKAIYIIRNPKDQAVSWYHFTKKVPLFKKSSPGGADLGSDWGEFFDKYMKGEHPTSSRRGEGYAEHIRSWLIHQNDKDCLFLFYEDMKKNFPKEIRKIAAFLDVKLSDERVSRIADRCSFSSMKKDFEADKMEARKLIVRKGEVGSWKNEFTDAQSKRMDAHIQAVLGDSGIKFTYEL